MAYPTIERYEVTRNSGYAQDARWLVRADYGDGIESDESVPEARRFRYKKYAVQLAARLNAQAQEVTR